MIIFFRVFFSEKKFILKIEKKNSHKWFQSQNSELAKPSEPLYSCTSINQSVRFVFVSEWPSEEKRRPDGSR